MMDPLLPALDLVQRTLAVEIAYTVSRMQVAERIPGNPIGMAYRWVDDRAVAMMSRLPAFARVMGLRSGHERHIEPLVHWYREHGIKPTFEMVPALWDASLGRELARLGFYQSGFHAALICAPAPGIPTEAEARIEAVTTAEAMEHYLDAYVAGWGIPEKDQFKANVRPWLRQPGWSLYLARIDGKPAAAATLYVKDRIGYLADAATDPAFRRHGLQTALLRRRMRDAGPAGADLLCSGADPFSTSHRNMERAGMRLQFVRAMWTLVP